jgi:hypothetical protein
MGRVKEAESDYRYEREEYDEFLEFVERAPNVLTNEYVEEYNNKLKNMCYYCNRFFEPQIYMENTELMEITILFYLNNSDSILPKIMNTYNDKKYDTEFNTNIIEEIIKHYKEEKKDRLFMRLPLFNLSLINLIIKYEMLDYCGDSGYYFQNSYLLREDFYCFIENSKFLLEQELVQYDKFVYYDYELEIYNTNRENVDKWWTLSSKVLFIEDEDEISLVNNNNKLLREFYNRYIKTDKIEKCAKFIA